ncbi:MAG TPA: molybdate ABC transporter substrate-binding protein [Syntrophorhabdales bacterium]|nr:molybdate ABC transporter substrate-binding protein [Syntrophorhabdales bacterium]
MLTFFLAFIMLVTLNASAIAEEITVAAGAGLKDVLNDIAAAYVHSNPSVRVTKSWVVSGVLAKQLDSGARLDIVFTANREWMDYVKEKKHVDPATITPFAYNTVVFVGKGPRRVSRLDELKNLNRIAVGSPKSVPAGEYAMEALKNAGIDKQVEGKLVMARDVRESLLYAERGEVDGAFVYKTDALLSREVAIWFTVPQNLYSRVVYLSALTVSGVGNQDAVNFFSFLRSAEAGALLQKYGFEAP